MIQGSVFFFFSTLSLPPCKAREAGRCHRAPLGGR